MLSNFFKTPCMCVGFFCCPLFVFAANLCRFAASAFATAVPAIRFVAQTTGMKYYFLIFFLIPAICLRAQSSAGNVSGSVTDEKGGVLAQATVSLFQQQDSALAKIALSDSAGAFAFSGVAPGSYFVSASYQNQNARTSPTFVLSQSNPAVALPPLAIFQNAEALAGVVVTVKKPLVEQKIDRLVVNVDAAITNAGATALEVLQKAPGVSVDKDGNISLRGKSSVLVLLDGKPLYLGSAELAYLLSSMNASQLQQIELMTNPSARYDAAGNAGVINLKTKKSTTQGFNGTVTLGYGQGVYPKSNNSIQLNYRLGKVSTFLNYGSLFNQNMIHVDAERTFLTSTGAENYSLSQHTDGVNKSTNTI